MNQEPKLCECGCGQPTKIVRSTDKRANVKEGDYRRFLHGHGSRVQRNQFDLRYTRGTDDECWIWEGRQREGRGRFGSPSRLAHRVAWERSIGPLGLTDKVMHTCPNSLCVNPKHLALTPPMPPPPNPGGMCQCGCGKPAPIATQSSIRLGHLRGEPTYFVRGHGAQRPIPVLDSSRWRSEDRGYATPCWIRNGFVDVNGYTHVSVNGKNRPSHRAAYEEAVGPIPEGFHVHHHCRQKACMNPDHLEAMSVRAHAAVTAASKHR